jgi:hypothetical protein
MTLFDVLWIEQYYGVLISIHVNPSFVYCPVQLLMGMGQDQMVLINKEVNGFEYLSGLMDDRTLVLSRTMGYFGLT